MNLKKKPLILTDLDDTVVHWGQGFVNYMDSLGHDTEKAHSNLNVWIDNHSHIRKYNLVDQFNTCEQFAELKPYDDALEVVNRMKRNGWHFIAISMVNKDPKSLAYRTQNLEKYFPGVFESIIHTGFTHQAKVKYLEWFKNAVWVEDSLSNARDGRNAGHYTFLLNRNYNSSPEERGINRVNTWYDIEDYLENGLF